MQVAKPRTLIKSDELHESSCVDRTVAEAFVNLWIAAFFCCEFAIFDRFSSSKFFPRTVNECPPFDCSGKEIDPQNPWNMTGKQLDLNKSAVLSQINSAEPKIQSE